MSLQVGRARAKLEPAADVHAYTELTHGMAVHAFTAVALRRHGIDLDQHQGMARWLQQQGHPDVARAFGTIESLRIGRWYGRQGNGATAQQLDELLAQIEAWSMA